MVYSPLLVVHICAGIVGLLAGFSALAFRKGSQLHRRTGHVFVVAMLIMAASGALTALFRSQPLNLVAGVFTFYLVASAWVTVAPRDVKTHRLEIALTVLGLATATGGVILAAGATKRGVVIGCVVFAVLALLLAAADIRMLLRSLSASRRLARHVLRTCMALLIATASIRPRVFTPAMRSAHVPEMLVLFVLAVMVFWLFRIRYAKVERKVAL